MLKAVADSAMARPIEIAKDDIALRLLLRSCGNIAGVIVLTRTGLVAEGRTIARCLLENVLGAEKLRKTPEEYIKLLNDDFELSQRKLLELLRTLSLDDLTDLGQAHHRENLKDLSEKTGNLNKKKTKFIKQDELAKAGDLGWHYSIYKYLSNDAAHTTAQSLDRYAKEMDGNGCYLLPEGTNAEHADTLHYAVTFALHVGAIVLNVLSITKFDAHIQCLERRKESMVRQKLSKLNDLPNQHSSATK